VRGKRKGERPGIEASTRKWKEVSSHLSLLTSHPKTKASRACESWIRDNSFYNTSRKPPRCF